MMMVLQCLFSFMRCIVLVHLGRAFMLPMATFMTWQTFTFTAHRGIVTGHILSVDERQSSAHGHSHFAQLAGMPSQPDMQRALVGVGFPNDISTLIHPWGEGLHYSHAGPTWQSWLVADGICIMQQC